MKQNRMVKREQVEREKKAIYKTNFCVWKLSNTMKSKAVFLLDVCWTPHRFTSVSACTQKLSYLQYGESPPYKCFKKINQEDIS